MECARIVQEANERAREEFAASHPPTAEQAGSASRHAGGDGDGDGEDDADDLAVMEQLAEQDNEGATPSSPPLDPAASSSSQQQPPYQPMTQQEAEGGDDDDVDQVPLSVNRARRERKQPQSYVAGPASRDEGGEYTSVVRKSQMSGSSTETPESQKAARRGGGGGGSRGGSSSADGGAQAFVKEAEGYRLFPSPRKGSTGYKGVSSAHYTKKFEVTYWDATQKKAVYLSTHDTAVEAAVAYARHMAEKGVYPEEEGNGDGDGGGDGVGTHADEDGEMAADHEEEEADLEAKYEDRMRGHIAEFLAYQGLREGTFSHRVDATPTGELWMLHAHLSHHFPQAAAPQQSGGRSKKGGGGSSSSDATTVSSATIWEQLVPILTWLTNLNRHLEDATTTTWTPDGISTLLQSRIICWRLLLCEPLRSSPIEWDLFVERCSGLPHDLVQALRPELDTLQNGVSKEDSERGVRRIVNTYTSRHGPSEIVEPLRKLLALAQEHLPRPYLLQNKDALLDEGEVWANKRQKVAMRDLPFGRGKGRA